MNNIITRVGLRDMDPERWEERVNATTRPKLERSGRLNPSQITAVCAGLTQSVTLILGPPGCGKTSTAAVLIAEWLEAGMGPILATADSNTAVDNLLDALTSRDSPLANQHTGAPSYSIVRVGRSEAVRPELMKYSLEGMAPPGSSRETIAKIQKSALKGAAVVCATSSVAGGGVLESWRCQAVLIDEASQATEPSLLVPMACGAPKIIALFGDNRQLPPTIVSRSAELGGLSVSLYDRFSKGGAPSVLLNTQYRMHPSLAVFPSAAFYEGRVMSGIEAATRLPPANYPWPRPDVGLAFVDVEGHERSDGTSHYNEREVGVVCEIVGRLLGGWDRGGSGGLQPHHVGIITPYASQVRLLKRALPQHLRGVEVGSVDGYQGREKEVIVFSCVRCNSSGNVGFLADERRVNVMLTRARRGLIVVGHGGTLRREEKCWGKWMHWMAEGGFLGGGGGGLPQQQHMLLPPPFPSAAAAPYQTLEQQQQQGGQQGRPSRFS